MEKNCITCRLRGTRLCGNPLECIQAGFSCYRGIDPSVVCPEHGQVLLVQKTDPIKGSNVVYTFKVCPICGYRVRVTREFKMLTPATSVKESTRK